MSNPFPGVNPYVESEDYWEDFHGTFVPALREGILDKLPAHYDATVSERQYLALPGHWEDFHTRFLNTLSEHLLAALPSEYDATINERQYLNGGPLDVPASRYGAGSNAVPEPPSKLKPFVTHVPGLEEVREVWVEIRRLDDRSLVTAIEVLSPTNRQREGFGLYHRKRMRLLARKVHLVELDMLIRGKRPRFDPPPPPRHFYAYVTRIDTLPDALAYGWDLPDPLPELPIPLRAPDPDVFIDLQPAYAETFRRGQYPRRLRYDKPVRGIDEESAAWARRTAEGAEKRK